MKKAFSRWIYSGQAAIAITTAAFAFAGCAGMNNLPKLPWSHARSAGTQPSPYAPVPIANDPVAPSAPEVPGTTIDRVVASVDGNPITSYDVNNPSAGQSNGMAGAANPAAASGDPDAVLKSLIAEQLLNQESAKYANKVDEEQIDQVIQNLAQRDHMTESQMRDQLKAQGISYGEFRNEIRKQVQAMTMVDHEVRQKIHIPDSEIEAYYKSHPDEFTVTEEKYHLAQILVAVPDGAKPDQVEAAKSKADDIRTQLLKGKDFAVLASQDSDDDSKTKGGDLGEFAPGDLNDQIATAIKNVKPGDISDVLRTKYGFQIIKVVSHDKPGTKPLDEVKSEIRDKLTTEQAKAEFQHWIDHDLAKRHDVETMN